MWPSTILFVFLTPYMMSCSCHEHDKPFVWLLMTPLSSQVDCYQNLPSQATYSQSTGNHNGALYDSASECRHWLREYEFANQLPKHREAVPVACLTVLLIVSKGEFPWSVLSAHFSSPVVSWHCSSGSQVVRPVLRALTSTTRGA